MNRAKYVLIALSFLLCTGSAMAADAQQSDDSLYLALGAKPGITVIVDTMLSNVADDMRIVHYFANVNIRHTRRGLITEFCAISGGPCEYTGESMADTHRGLHVTAAAFNALVEDLQAAMTKLNIPITTQNRLLARLAPMRNDIVESSERD